MVKGGSRSRRTGRLARLFAGLGAIASFASCARDDADALPDGGLGGSAGGTFQPSPEPLYGEEGDPPEQLSLVFRTIFADEVDSATDFAFFPSEGNLNRTSLLLLSRDNRMHRIWVEDGAATLAESWDFADDSYFGEACAPTNVLFDPNFLENRFIYVTKCVDVETTQLLRFAFDEERGPTDASVIFETVGPGEVAGWHRMGSMGWEDEGILWLLVGDHDDRAARADAQDVGNPLGALVRLVPNRDPEGSGYSPAPGNLAAQSFAPEGAHPALFAYGFRSPWRGTRDALGRYWVGDVGRDSFEEVDLVVAPGQNFGWNLHEGPCESECGDSVNPLVSYDWDPSHRYIEEGPGSEASADRAIWVGQIYEDPSVDRYETLMDGVVPFGDLFMGFVRGLRADENGVLTMDAPIGLLQGVTSWKVGPDGYVYVADLYGNLHVAVLEYE